MKEIMKLLSGLMLVGVILLTSCGRVPAGTPTGVTKPSQTPSSLPDTAPLKSSPAPTVVNAPAGEGNQPYADAPACPTHDPNQWHGLWDEVRGCHYDHTHGDDPSLADSYFGPLGAYWDGATISYPFNSGPAENTSKHAGYKVSVKMPGYHPWSPCGVNDNTDVTGDHSDNCVIASRVEYHLVGGLMDTVHRYHSYWMEIYVCRPPIRPLKSAACFGQEASWIGVS